MSDVIPLRLSGHQFLRIVRGLATDTVNVKFSGHALDRMRERGYTTTQVYACIRKGSLYEPVHQDIRGDYKCTLRHICSGDEVKVAIALKRNDRGGWIAVITVF
ncbi:DUF4258 domain-containing protein [Bordetella sp. N]|uniref:DUF4258 domain-containing protein n=1 Tax=Bordetella sp. N TaxID=1746199 RepID=UPI0007109980|nr:DUF4258 domain-containing protein [Bordetella sp. N]ALM86998.1 hypothetical protein ASB57_15115 [Bordetella sp. N]